MAWVAACSLGAALPVINEVLLDPPGPNTPYQYVEIRGVPNSVLPEGTYFLAVEGDTNGNPGTVQNIFDLSGRRIGGNGFLVLLQKDTPYSVVFGATALINTNSGSGFGSGSSSSINHRGEDNQVDLEPAAVTFFLIQTTNRPVIGQDLDADNDGRLDAEAVAGWNVLDSIGILDSDGAGDVAYGAINFRRNPASTALTNVVEINFTPRYIGRAGNTTGAAAADWVASGTLSGSAPVWTLNATDTVPAAYRGMPLNHVGGPNFGAESLPGVILSAPWPLVVTEDGATSSYSLMLNTQPGGPVTVQINCDSQVEISLDGGLTYGADRTLVFSNTAARTIRIRAVDDNAVEASPHSGCITHTVIGSADSVHYPVGILIPPAFVQVVDNDALVLNEVKINPPGPDAPYEYIELRGMAGGWLRQVYLLVLEGRLSKDPGKASVVVNLSTVILGTNGLAVVAATNAPYVFAPATTVVPCAELSQTGGALDNEAATIMLVASETEILQGTDLDKGDNGILEGLPPNARILDAVAWNPSGASNVLYGGVVLELPVEAPAAAVRFPDNATPLTAGAWFFGQLAGTNGASQVFGLNGNSPNFPVGAQLSPGAVNDVAIRLSGLTPICGAIGDPTNPRLWFVITNDKTNPPPLQVSVSSDNAAVVSGEGLVLENPSPGIWSLAINPSGVGYAQITLTVSDGESTAQTIVPYAASAMGRPGGIFLATASDLSAALALDENWMLVGNDEDETLRLYPRDRSGPPVWRTNMTPFLGLTDFENGIPREVDIEAVTRLGNRIYWMGAHSHANTNAFETRTNRSRIFVTDLTGSGTNINLTYVGRYDFLKLDLVNWDVNNGHGKGANYYGLAASTEAGVNPKSYEGFNIEGVTFAPGNSNVAYVAFRAPLVPATNRHFALIVPVLNFATLAAGNGPPGSAVFGAPIELDLFERGIRDIRCDNSGCLIIAGSPLAATEPYPNDFKLYIWSGNPADLPHELEADLTGLNPEAIVELPPRPWLPDTMVQLVSDTGTTVYYGDGVMAKHLAEPNFKKSRADTVRMGNVVVPAPILQSCQYNSNGVTIRWRATAGATYRVQWKTAMSAPWQDLPGDVVADGIWASKIDPPPVYQKRFYRIIVP